MRILRPARALLALFGIGLLQAAVHRVHVVERLDVMEGRAFGNGGAYEKVKAVARFQIDPKSPANQMIRDLSLAPVNDQGMVEFDADLYVLKPRDPSKANGTLLFEVSNRGGKGMLSMFNRARSSMDPSSAEEFGDAYLLEQGYTLVWLGWQWDSPRSPNRLGLRAPLLNGLKGVVRAEFVPDEKVNVFALADRDHTAYPVLNLQDPTAVLTVRDRGDGPARLIPRQKWQFEDATHVALSGGFEPGKVYEVVYQSDKPVVTGLGLAGVRDLISFLKYGGVETLLADQRRFLKRAVGFGTSQSGRFLRHFVYEGFNADEKGRKVFDGLWPHVAGAGRGSFNHRFAQPSRDGQPLLHYLWPADQFPFTDGEQTDAVLGKTDGLLRRAEAAKVAPKIFYTNGSYEYWGRDAALIHTNVEGTRDVAAAPDSRIYFFAGAQHGAGSFPPRKNKTQGLANSNDYRFLMRGLLAAMNAWLRDGKEPPPSNIPKLSDRSLVDLTRFQFPALTGVNVPKHPRIAYRLDFGPDFETKGIVTKEPPQMGRPYPVLLPAVDSDGNETTGLKTPEVAAPLGTYTGWNLRAPSIGSPQEMIAFIGTFVPFPRTKAERAKTKDPRPSIEERYGTREAYLAKVRESAKAGAGGGFLLERDIEALVERSAQQWDYWMTGK